eukprot:TRINITY_DN11632_c0_g1_i4.p1 TRINITY_DN11632_c0_g1~~TRINITY_DN11632_c0_g1_i4.p1  ORF type:complete len:707 (+),score=214.68 TRINITY_DN11632_c0_g1_i4:16-2136(+)
MSEQPPTETAWPQQLLWMQLIYEERLEEMVAMVQDGKIDIDMPLPPLELICTDIPPFIPGPTMVRWKGGDTALHFALREQKRESVTLLVELEAVKEGDNALNEHQEDPRTVAQTIDHYQDAAQCGDFEPLEPLLDPFDTVHVAIATFQQGLTSKVVNVDVRLKPASPRASEALIQCAGDTTESFFKKLARKLKVHQDTHAIWFEGAELLPGETLMLNGLYEGCHLWMLRKPDPITVLVSGWTNAAVKNLSSPGYPLEDHSFEMRLGLRDQYIKYGQIEEEFLSDEIGKLQAEVLDRDHINSTDQEISALQMQSDKARLAASELTITAASAGPEADAAKAQHSELLRKIEQGNHWIFEDMTLKRSEYVGLLEGNKRFGEYYLQPEQTVMVSPPHREAAAEGPRLITMWHNGTPDNAGAAFAKVRHSEQLGMPTFVPPPVWSGEQLVAYGNLSTGKWEQDLLSNPKDVYAMRRLGRAHAAVGMLESALHFYRNALAEDPEYYYARRDLALALFLLGQPDQALGELRTVLSESDGRYGQAWCDVGDILASEGDWAGAAEHYEKALELDLGNNLSATATTVPSTPAQAAALRGLGCCACANNQFKRGVQLLEQALLLAPADHVAIQMLSLAKGDSKMQFGDQHWRDNSRLSMMTAQLLCTDPTQASSAAKLLQAAIRSNKQPATQSELLKLGSALSLRHFSLHSPFARMF